jgi:ABC-type uncharacterized transport system substrate-binding protein
MTVVSDQWPGRKSVFFFFALGALLLALCIPTQAQQPGKIPKVGLLTERREVSANIEAFEQELRRLGYVEGKNLAIERRNSMGDTTRLPTLTAELVQQRVDVILAPGTPAALAAKNGTRTISIVFATVSDAVRSGLVESFGTARWKPHWLDPDIARSSGETVGDS